MRGLWRLAARPGLSPGVSQSRTAGVRAAKETIVRSTGHTLTFTDAFGVFLMPVLAAATLIDVSWKEEQKKKWVEKFADLERELEIQRAREAEAWSRFQARAIRRGALQIRRCYSTAAAVADSMDDYTHSEESIPRSTEDPAVVEAVTDEVDDPIEALLSDRGDEDPIATEQFTAYSDVDAISHAPELQDDSAVQDLILENDTLTEVHRSGRLKEESLDVGPLPVQDALDEAFAGEVTIWELSALDRQLLMQYERLLGMKLALQLTLQLHISGSMPHSSTSQRRFMYVVSDDDREILPMDVTGLMRQLQDVSRQLIHQKNKLDLHVRAKVFDLSDRPSKSFLTTKEMGREVRDGYMSKSEFILNFASEVMHDPEPLDIPTLSRLVRFFRQWDLQDMAGLVASVIQTSWQRLWVKDICDLLHYSTRYSDIRVYDWILANLLKGGANHRVSGSWERWKVSGCLLPVPSVFHPKIYRHLIGGALSCKQPNRAEAWASVFEEHGSASWTKIPMFEAFLEHYSSEFDWYNGRRWAVRAMQWIANCLRDLNLPVGKDLLMTYSSDEVPPRPDQHYFKLSSVLFRILMLCVSCGKQSQYSLVLDAATAAHIPPPFLLWHAPPYRHTIRSEWMSQLSDATPSDELLLQLGTRVAALASSEDFQHISSLSGEHSQESAIKHDSLKGVTTSKSSTSHSAQAGDRDALQNKVLEASNTISMLQTDIQGLQTSLKNAQYDNTQLKRSRQIQERDFRMNEDERASRTNEYDRYSSPSHSDERASGMNEYDHYSSPSHSDERASGTHEYDRYSPPSHSDERTSRTDEYDHYSSPTHSDGVLGDVHHNSESAGSLEQAKRIEALETQLAKLAAIVENQNDQRFARRYDQDEISRRLEKHRAASSPKAEFESYEDNPFGPNTQVFESTSPRAQSSPGDIAPNSIEIQQDALTDFESESGFNIKSPPNDYYPDSDDDSGYASPGTPPSPTCPSPSPEPIAEPLPFGAEDTFDDVPAAEPEVESPVISRPISHGGVKTFKPGPIETESNIPITFTRSRSPDKSIEHYVHRWKPPADVESDASEENASER